MANMVHFMIHRNLHSEGGAECRDVVGVQDPV